MGDTTQGENTAAGLKERLGALFDEIFALGRRAGRDEGYREGLAEGARSERERISAVLAQPPPGPVAPVGEPARAGGTGGAEAAPKAPAAERPRATAPASKVRKAPAAEKPKATGRHAEGKGDSGRRPLPASEDQGDLEAAVLGLPLEERCRADWEREPGLRSEFATLEAYTAFTRQREAGNKRI